MYKVKQISVQVYKYLKAGNFLSPVGGAINMICSLFQ